MASCSRSTGLLLLVIFWKTHMLSRSNFHIHLFKSSLDNVHGIPATLTMSTSTSACQSITPVIRTTPRTRARPMIHGPAFACDTEIHTSKCHHFVTARSQRIDLARRHGANQQERGRGCFLWQAFHNTKRCMHS